MELQPITTELETLKDLARWVYTRVQGPQHGRWSYRLEGSQLKSGATITVNLPAEAVAPLTALVSEKDKKRRKEKGTILVSEILNALRYTPGWAITWEQVVTTAQEQEVADRSKEILKAFALRTEAQLKEAALTLSELSPEQAEHIDPTVMLFAKALREHLLKGA